MQCQAPYGGVPLHAVVQHLLTLKLVLKLLERFLAPGGGSSVFAGLMLCKVQALSTGGGGAGRWSFTGSRTDICSQSAEVFAVAKVRDDDADEIVPSEPRATFIGGCELDLCKPGVGNRVPWFA